MSYAGERQWSCIKLRDGLRAGRENALARPPGGIFMQDQEQEQSLAERGSPHSREEASGVRLAGSTSFATAFPAFPAISLAEEGSLLSLLNSWLDVLPDALVIINQAGKIVVANRQLETLIGYSRQELIGLPLEVLLPERFHAAHVLHREHYAATPRIRPMGAGLELYGRRKDGSEVPVDISLSPLPFNGALYVLGAIRDITERRRLQEREQRARQEAETRLELLQLILDELPTSVCLVQGEEARLVLANRAAATIWGATWRVGQPMHDFLATHHIQVFDAHGKVLPLAAFATLRAIHHHESVRQYQEIIRRPDGTLLPVLVSSVALSQQLLREVPALGRRDDPRSGLEEPGALVVHQDVTERLELECRKDEFIGMAGHELKTPLTSIKLAVQWLFRRVKQLDDEPAAQVLTKMDTQLGTLTRLINELLDVTKMTTGTLVSYVLEQHC
jgi:PAS domain S-box-containing protein